MFINLIKIRPIFVKSIRENAKIQKFTSVANINSNEYTKKIEHKEIKGIQKVLKKTKTSIK